MPVSAKKEGNHAPIPCVCEGNHAPIPFGQFVDANVTEDEEISFPSSHPPPLPEFRVCFSVRGGENDLCLQMQFPESEATLTLSPLPPPPDIPRSQNAGSFHTATVCRLFAVVVVWQEFPCYLVKSGGAAVECDETCASAQVDKEHSLSKEERMRQQELLRTQQVSGVRVIVRFRVFGARRDRAVCA